MTSIDRELEALEADLERASSRTIVEVGGLFRNDYKALKNLLERLWQTYEKEGQIDYTAYIVEGEGEFKWKLARQMIKSYELIQNKTEEILEYTSDNTLQAIQDITKLKGIKRNIPVDHIINPEMQGINWRSVHAKNRDEVIQIIAKEVREGLEKGRTYTQMTDQLADRLGKELNVVERVVRTESRRVNTSSKLEGLKEANKKIPVQKRWISSGDERVRESHQLLDGETIPVDDYFEIHGYRAEGPGLFGEPSQDIGCRCFLSMELDI